MGHMENIPKPDKQFRAWFASLHAVLHALERIERDFESQTGLQHHWYEVLIRLYKEPDRRLRMSDLANRGLISPGGATRLVARMEEAGYVEREIPADNRRTTYAVLTDKGVKAVETAAPAHFEAVERHFGSALSEDDAEQLMSLSDKIIHSLGEDCAWLTHGYREDEAVAAHEPNAA